ncbi:MAG: hypothetical protein Q7S99_13395 [Parvibaculum sp.]|nr:hypothetical protein [Parvibaculum sp.]
MTDNSAPHSSIERSFCDLSADEVGDIEQVSSLFRTGWYKSFGWEELMRSDRILIVSEAGAGKTYECQSQKEKLWNAGEPAFFFDLATLASNSVRDMLSQQEEERFDVWLRSQSETATFFLDSIDELKLTLGNFDLALKRLGKALEGQLRRSRIIITTRPVPIDRELIVRHLPIPASAVSEPTAEAFADRVMQRNENKSTETAGPLPWRYVRLMPLSFKQMRDFASLQSVSDPDNLLADIRRRDAEDFAERPQDLIELCSDWREHQRIRTHREQVKANVSVKLKSDTERRDRAELSQEKAIEGASSLALAAMLTRKLTLKQSTESDIVSASEAALDVSKILLSWSGEERATLLERSLFGFASYGRVRFHHRSVVEFLAAARLDALLDRGVPIKAIKRLLFIETAQGTEMVRPSLRPVAAWLALSHDSIFDRVVLTDPAVVLDHGDPQSLRLDQRIRALESYVNRYGDGGWRGLSTPRIQVHRFASIELSEAISRLWGAGIQNPEVRELLLQIIGVGQIKECRDIVYSVAISSSESDYERTLAIRALAQWDDPSLESVGASLNDIFQWSDAMARFAVVELFPRHLTASRLLSVLKRIRESRRSIGEISYHLPRKIADSEFLPNYLEELRDGLTELIVSNANWSSDEFPQHRTMLPHLVPVLVAVCHRQFIEGVRSTPWIASSLLAIRFLDDRHDEKDAVAELRGALANLPSDVREVAFWEEDMFLQKMHKSSDAWSRVFDLSQRGGLPLNEVKDAVWVRKRLSDRGESVEHREMMLRVELVLFNRAVLDRREHLESLKQCVSDVPGLVEIVERQLMPSPDAESFRRSELKYQENKRKAERRDAKAFASWVSFWKEILEAPSKVFAEDRAENTAWNLWQAVRRSGNESRASGWSRRFIEEQFGKSVADQLREIMMKLWREDRPTLRSERSDKEKNTFLVRWQFGLAAISAEAEDENWAKRLSEQEAELACRYAPIELNGFPSWLSDLTIEHPVSVDNILGTELTLSLAETFELRQNSMFLQNVNHAPAIVVALFVPRIRRWLADEIERDARSNEAQHELDVRQAVEIILKNGNQNDLRFMEEAAKKGLADNLSTHRADLWISVLLHLNPLAGVEHLERGTEGLDVSKAGVGAQLFANLFRRDRRGAGFNLKVPAFTPQLLLRLLRLAYQHVQIEDDAQHEGSYTPDVRDDAEKARNAVLAALLATTGPEGWAAKLEMTSDALFGHIKDRVAALAQERAAEEADNVAMTEADFVVLDARGEAPPATSDAMFALLRDRLDDIDDLLLQDVSPREAWAGITEERVMRRELTRELKNSSNQNYKVDQEAATADEKETDIRLRSTGSEQQAVIELKLGNNRTATDLFNTIKDQLLVKYMAAEECRAGCLLVTISKQREWDHPTSGERIDFETLIGVLDAEANRLSRDLGGAAKLMVKGLDLRPRLSTETKKRAGST